MEKKKRWTRKVLTLLVVAAVSAACGFGMDKTGASVQAAETEAVTPTIIGAEESADNVPVYTYALAENQKTGRIPIQVEQAGHVIVEVTVSTSAEKVAYKLYQNAGKTYSYVAEEVSGASRENIKMSGMVETPGLVYWEISLTGANDTASASVSMKVYEKLITPGSSLSEGEWASGYGDSLMPVDYKIKVSSAGLLKIEASSDYARRITLLDSNQKELKETYGESVEETTYFGVEKGTYYIRAAIEGNYKLRYTFTSAKIKKSSNCSRKKAITLKQGKSASGIFSLKDMDNKNKRYRWYKIKVSSKKKIQIKVTKKGNTAGNQVGLIVYEGDSKDELMGVWLKKKSNTKKVTLEKGTYYLALFGSSPGLYYAISWK